MLCWIASPAAGVSLSSHEPAPDGTMLRPASRNGKTTVTTATVMAAALRRSTAPRATAKMAATASSAAVPTITRASVRAGTVSSTWPWLSSLGTPRAIAITEAISPVTNAAAPTTKAFAASTAPRRGVAVSVVRISPRRYSVVKNIAATTTIAISPMKTPTRLCSTVTVGRLLPGPGVTGAMSPDPVTVNVPPACLKGAGPRPPGPTATGPPRPIAVPVQVAPAAAPDTLTWSKTPVAWAGPPWKLDPPNEFWVTVYAGEVANMPACTVAGSRASRAVPTFVQCTPSAES